MRVILAGCGALGSLIAMGLADVDNEFFLVDDDRIEANNISTSAYYLSQVGMLKTSALANLLYRKARVEGRAYSRTLRSASWPLRQAPDLVIVTFDNVDARTLLCNQFASNVGVVHVGVSEDRTGGVAWEPGYALPIKRFERGHNPVCTNELGAAILSFTAAAAIALIRLWITTGRKRAVMVLQDGTVI